jgi:galactokinase/mevalonate kinase-like predicted kinase
LQSSFAIYALTSAIHVLRNVKGTMLTIAKDAHRYAATALTNAEGWQDKLGKDQPTTHFFLLMLL